MMSDVSVLSIEYHTASELSEAVNALLVTLKKARLGIEDTNFTQESFREARERFAYVLEVLRVLLDARSSDHVNGVIAAQIPSAFVNRILRERTGDLPWFLLDIERIAKRLRNNWKDLTDRDIEQLDHLAALVDAEASVVFRQLMRR